mgnify:CR=1 FL=1
MMFKNSTKLLIANFSLVWKLILYYIIVCGIVIGLIAPFFGTIADQLNTTGALSEFGSLLTNFNVSVNPFQLLVNMNEVVVEFLDLFVEFWQVNPGAAFYICFVLLYVFPFLIGLADLPVGQTLFGYMSSLTKYSFVGSYMRYFARSARYSLFKSLIMLPVNLLIVVAIVFTLRLNSVGGILIYFMPFILVAVLVALVALKKTFFAGWMPAIVVYDYNMFKGFRKGFKAVVRRFFKVFSTAICIMLLAVAFNYLFGTFAFPIIIPVFVAMFYVFEMVMFYGSQGMRYYVDLDTILSPKRLEENDSFREVKDLI